MKENKKRIPLRLILAVVAALLVVVIIVMLATGKTGSLKRTVTNLFGGGNTEFYYSAGSDSVFGRLGDNLAVVSVGSLQTYNTDGDELINENMLMSAPAVYTAGEYAVAYDMGGESFKVFTANQVIYSNSETGKEIISASVNENGWAALCTEEEGYKGAVTVYDADGDAVYKWYSGEGYLLSAALSPDNMRLAALVITEQGSKIVFYRLDSEELSAQYAADGAVLLDIRFLTDSRLICIGAEQYTLLGTDGQEIGTYNFSGKYLNNYAIDSGRFTALVINDYQVGNHGQIVTVGTSGTEIAALEITEEVAAVSACGDFLAVLYADRLVIYNSSLDEIATYTETGAAFDVIVREDGSAIVLNSYSAVVCN
jgi:hypothetical protein